MNKSYLEIINKPQITSLKCIVLDYDGTLTTLRKGWDVILTDYTLSKANPENLYHPEIESKIKAFTDHAGGTTPKQLMSRLVALIEDLGMVDKSDIESVDFYAREYAAHFTEKINARLKDFSENREEFLIRNVREMLDFIKNKKTVNYVVTGSCEIAVSSELKQLEMFGLFEKVYGASLEMEGNLKLDAMNEILEKHRLDTSEVLVVGDGSTEMRAAKELGLPALGIASNEHTGGLCDIKREMLAETGAHAIVSDYSNFEEVWDWLHD